MLKIKKKLNQTKKIILIISLIILYSKTSFLEENGKKIEYLKYRDENLQLYKDILPKTNDQNKEIQSLEEIFNSRRLFISDANLTPEYIRYLRKINETEEEIYKKNILKMKQR